MSETRDLLSDGAASGRANSSIIDRLCEVVSALALIAMMTVIATEIAARTLFGFSFQMSDDLGGYLFVMVTFISMPVAQARSSFHHVEFIQARLSARNKLILQLLFDVLSLITMGVISWQLLRFEISSYNSGDVADSLLAMPLWIPRLSMPVGTILLCLLLLREILTKTRRLRAPVISPGGATS